MTESGLAPKKVAVLGGGNSAFATAAALSMLGHEVGLLEAPEFAGSIEPLRSEKCIELEAPALDGVEEGRARLSCVSIEPSEVMEDVDVVLFLVPAYAEKRFFELCSRHFRPSQLVVLFCGNFGGALSLASCLRQNGHSDLPLIMETDGLYYGGFKSGPARVRLSGLKQGLAAAALPAKDTEAGLVGLNALFPNYGFAEARNVIETGLRNMNPMLHPAISILNMGRICPERAPFLYYKEGITPGVGRVIQAVDEERLAVGKALGLSLAPLQEVILSWYGWQGARGENLHELLTGNPAYQTAVAPSVLEHRFLTEDVPFGLVPIAELGAATGTPTPVIDALVALAGTLLAADLRLTGRGLESLGLSGLSPSEIMAYAHGVAAD